MELGLPKNVVRLAPYSPEWPMLFEKEKARLSDSLRLLDHVVEHIGSTAVPGLHAKPVLDIMIGLPNLQEMEAADAELVKLGYEAKGEKGVPGRLFLTLGDPCLYHVHLTQLHSAFWYEHLLFRDSLRQQETVASNYLAIKIRLAQAYPNDRDSYTRGKADFIEHVIAEAGARYAIALF